MDAGYNISDAYVERNLRAELKRFADENARLNNEVVKLKEELALSRDLRRSQAQVNGDLSEQLAAAQADAARYRKLRELNDSTADGCWLVNTQHGWAKDLDAAIDSAMEEVGHE